MKSGAAAINSHERVDSRPKVKPRPRNWISRNVGWNRGFTERSNEVDSWLLVEDVSGEGVHSGLLQAWKMKSARGLIRHKVQLASGVGFQGNIASGFQWWGGVERRVHLELGGGIGGQLRSTGCQVESGGEICRWLTAIQWIEMNWNGPGRTRVKGDGRTIEGVEIWIHWRGVGNHRGA